PHVEWALTSALSAPAKLRWTTQHVDGQLRASSDWVGPVGTAGRIAQTLRNWPVLLFVVPVDPNDRVRGERYSFSPALGLWRGAVSANGDVMVGENRLRALLETARGAGKNSGFDLAGEIDRAMGTPWDEDLEAFRGGDEGIGADVMWLRRDVG